MKSPGLGKVSFTLLLKSEKLDHLFLMKEFTSKNYD